MKEYKLKLTEEEIKTFALAEIIEIGQLKKFKPTNKKDTYWEKCFNIHKTILSKINDIYSLKKLMEQDKKINMFLTKKWRDEALKEVKKYDKAIKEMKKDENKKKI